MKQVWKKGFALLLALSLAAGLAPAALAANASLSAASEQAAAYLKRTVTAPTVSSVAGEWSVLALSRLGCGGCGDWFALYDENLCSYVKATEGVLSTRKYTEYARTVLALTARGIDPRSVAGHDLLAPLGDYDNVLRQGINGPAYALIALDAGGYDMPDCAAAATQATRQLYLDEILQRQNSDGGWSLSGDSSEPDITGMVLQALCNYRDLPAVSAAVDAAIRCLSERQNSAGGFDGWGSGNSESVSQVLLALTELGIDPEDARFIKNGNSLTDNLLTFRRTGGGFAHIASETASNLMATEQALCALAACLRMERGEARFYNMTVPDAAVSVPDAAQAGKTFSDLTGHRSRAAIESLAQRGIINGMNETEYAPDATMTRAQFCAITVRALGFQAVSDTVFADVNAADWYEGFVGAAYAAGIVNGVTPTQFAPEATITRAQAAAMLARAARLCGMNTASSEAAAEPVLGAFSDGGAAGTWARGPLTFCLRNDILDRSGTLQPEEAVTRAEIADMLHAMLKAAKLI